MSRSMTRRSLVASAASAAMVAAVPRASFAQSEGQHSFWLPDESQVISNADLKLWSPGYGYYTAMLTITPKQEEIDWLLDGLGAPHVDFVFEFGGLKAARQEPDVILGASDHVRYAGAEVIPQDDIYMFVARCFNIERRWTADKPVTVTATIFGYGPSGNGNPRLSALMAPANYSLVGENDPHVYSRDMDNVTKYYAREAVGEPAELFDEIGNLRFPF